MVGSTACVVLISPTTIYCANAGDSRAVMTQGTGAPLALSKDHTPELKEERDRIVQAGGFVMDRRVNGELATSRALGDFHLKKQALPPEDLLVTAFPEVKEF